MGAIALLILAPTAGAAKQTIDFFGGSGSLGGQFSEQAGVAVNNSGAGPANPGDIYALDPGTFFGQDKRQNRIQRFGRDDNGTPANSADDSFFFISAWGAGVQSGGSDYEICTVVASCGAATPTGGNGTAAGNGALDQSQGIAIDQDTGNVYVADTSNNRINVYDGVGTFLRSFGYDVVASGPGQKAGPDEVQQLTVKAAGGRFSLSFEGQSTGGLGTGLVSGNSKVVNSVKASGGAFEVGQPISVIGSQGSFVPSGTTITAIEPGRLILSKASIGNNNNDPVTLIGDDLPHDVSAAALEAELNALPTIGGAGGSVSVSGGPGSESGSSPYAIEFGGALADEDVPKFVSSANGLTISAGSPAVSVAETLTGGVYETCVAADGDICKAGRPGAAIGQIGAYQGATLGAQGIALSAPDGNPSTGTVFLADGRNRRIDSFGLDGAAPAVIGSAATFEPGYPSYLTIDSRGVLYAANSKNEEQIERYDSLDANGDGVGFLAPIATGVEEMQKLTIDATAGTFRLTFDGETTADLAFDATSGQIESALQALPTSAGGSVNRSIAVSGEDQLYTITFRTGLGSKDVPQIFAANGSVPLSGGAGASVTTMTQGQPGLIGDTYTTGLAVDLDADGGGPDADALFVVRNPGSASAVQQFGPLNAPGLTAPPVNEDDRHGTNAAYRMPRGIAIDEATGQLFVSAILLAESGDNTGIHVLDNVGPPPVASLDSLSGPTAHSVEVHATIDPNGPPKTSYWLEYSSDGGSTWSATAPTLVGSQETPQAIDTILEPPPLGLTPNTAYEVRLVTQRRFAAAMASSALQFSTLPEKPLAETTGSPVRSATSAQLQGRVSPSGSPTTYRFEYGTQGPCDANPCSSSDPQAAGSGYASRLVAEQIEGISADTIYHYRVVAESSAPGSPAFGEDMTLSTRATDEPLAHGPLPGPPGSDRAWEQVSLPDSGGNPVYRAQAFATDGNRAIYQVFGGTPISETGSIGGIYSAQRTAAGWQTKLITPPREELIGPEWTGFHGAADLSDFSVVNRGGGSEAADIWRLAPEGQPSKLLSVSPPREFPNVRYFGASADGQTVVAHQQGGTLDPAYPAAAEVPNLYEIGSGMPQLVSLLPGNVLAECGADRSKGVELPDQAANWISADGSLVYFPSQGDDCKGPAQLYVRDLNAGITKAIPGAANLLRATPGAAFYATTASLDPDDEGGNDVYRYAVADASLECVTCVATVNANVGGSDPLSVAVAEDGSRVYFATSTQLLAGAPPAGQLATYRVEVASGELAYVVPDAIGGYVTDAVELSTDGSFLLFRSSEASLDALGGESNGATLQYYVYNDNDRALNCVSCPLDGSAPAGDTNTFNHGTKARFLAEDGTFAFATPTALVGADQNTPGVGIDPYRGGDVYEWRDGRQILITDGLINWPTTTQSQGAGPPTVTGISPSGRDVYFLASAQYTADALDGYQRLYDARIGGGFVFPPPPKPCPLEVCQGTPKGAPAEQEPGSGNFAGPGNATAPPAVRRCPKGKRKVRRAGKARCVKRGTKSGQQRRANDNRRAAR